MYLNALKYHDKYLGEWYKPLHEAIDIYDFLLSKILAIKCQSRISIQCKYLHALNESDGILGLI